MSERVSELGRRARVASRRLAAASTAEKDAALLTAADLLLERAPDILAANRADTERAAAEGMADGLRKVAALPDPVGEVLDGWVRPNGLEIQRVRVPLGVVAIIYENRPNVTSDAASLCLKSGNAALLRGSGSALRSNIAIAGVLREALQKTGLPEDGVVLVEDVAHETAIEVMQLTELVDCLIPRGGPALIDSVRKNARSRSSSTATETATSTSTPVQISTKRSTSSSTPRPTVRACATRPSRSSCMNLSPTRSSPVRARR